MAITQKTREKFIELRAENVSFDKIAKQLKVSKSTLNLWAKIYELDIQNLRAITHEALNQHYKASQEHRLQMWSEQLDSVREELKKRGFGDMPTPKLLQLLDTLSEKLKSEAYRIDFKGQKVVKPLDAEILTTAKQDTWNG
ncbi:MAG: hypothetical protein ACYCPS_01250 [Candidatus Saccharimonadales bacterium]